MRDGSIWTSSCNSTRYTVNIFVVFLYPNVPVDMIVPSAPATVPALTVEEVCYLVLIEHAMLPNLVQMHSVQVYNTAGSSMSIVSTVSRWPFLPPCMFLKGDNMLCKGEESIHCGRGIV